MVGICTSKIAVGNDAIDPPAVGSLIELDGRRGLSELLVACEYPEFATFRFPSASMKFVTGCVGPWCRVEVTGRTLQLRAGGLWVRVKVVFVADGTDGSEDTNAGGWMRVAS